MISRRSAWALAVLSVLASLQDAQALSMRLRKHHRNPKTAARGLHRRLDPGPLDIDNLYDLYYSTFLTIGGQELEVQLDTVRVVRATSAAPSRQARFSHRNGSPELWVRAKQDFAAPVESSNTSLTIRYGIGNFEGSLTNAEVVIGDVKIPQQSFLTYKQGSINNVFQAGLDGMLGLGFDEGSHVLTAQRQKTSDDSGRTLLSNFYVANPDEPRTMSFYMSRASDPDSEDDGVFMIGKPEAAYESVATAPAMPVHVNTHAGDFQRWSTYVDAFEVNGVNISLPTSVVDGAPSNRLVANMDTGTSLAWVPTQIVDAIYKDIPDAHYFADTDQYTVPCLSSVRVAVWFGGQRIPIHPMDLTRVQSQTNSDGTREYFCTNTFIHTSALATQSATLDMQLGDSLLRNVIAQYDFGTAGNPSTANIRMVSTIKDELASWNTFLQARAKQVGVDAPAPITELPGGSTSTPPQTGTTTASDNGPTPSAPAGAPPTIPSDESTSDGTSTNDNTSGDANSPTQNPDAGAYTTRMPAILLALLSSLVVFAF
ncbi:acid protease [Auriculariales sp. MPI-PUGE-AT-0066]|nr:acid protease [Auriculariales sp. MPI-PUGE-AT-0066]